MPSAQVALRAIGRETDSAAHVPEHPRSAAITHVLQLDDQAVRVGEVQFRRAFLCPAAIVLPQADVVDEWTGRTLTVATWFDPVCLQPLDDRVRVEILQRHAQMIDTGARSGARSAAACSTSVEYQKLDAAPPEHRGRGPLIRLNPETEQILPERARRGGIRHAVGGVAPSAQRKQPAPWRQRWRRAHIAERTGPAAVPRILQLHDEPVRIADVQLRRPLLRTTSVRASHSDAHLHGATAQPSTTGGSAVDSGHTVLREDAADAPDAEVLDAEGEMVEPRRTRTCGADP